MKTKCTQSYAHQGQSHKPTPVLTHTQHQGLGYNPFRTICFPLQVSRGKVPGHNLRLQPRLENKNFISLQQIVLNLDWPSNKGSSSLAAESKPLGRQSSSINCFDEGKK